MGEALARSGPDEQPIQRRRTTSGICQNDSIRSGRALTTEERTRLFAAAASNPEWEHVYCAAVVAANTSMRPVEVKHLRRRDVDLVKKLVHVRRSKNETSHRVIPLNASAIGAAARMFERADQLGHTAPEHYLWPACQWGRFDATNPMLKWDTAWRALRDAAGLPGLRFHDLRHTVITELAEMGVADHVLESISGHLSRRMLEHYSHIRIDAKRQALDALDAARRSSVANGDGNGNAENETEIPAIVELGEDLTSQSRHSLVIHLSVGSNLRRSRFVERFRSPSALSNSSVLSLATAFCDSVAVRPRVRPDAFADCALDCPCSALVSAHLRNSSTPSSTLRMRSATCTFVNTTCADAIPVTLRHARMAPTRTRLFIIRRSPGGTEAIRGLVRP